MQILKEIANIEDRYIDKEESISNFNIFSILRKESDEVNLHSKFIFELLNPEGSHGKNSLFLKLFLDEIGLDIGVEEKVFRERYNIDILIESSKEVIIVENKILTQDHSSQLSRYFKIIKNRGYKERDIKIVYLTLFGTPPIEKDMQRIVLNISYRDNIVNWILKSIEAVSDIPALKEVLVQYLSLVKKITNQSKEREYILEVKEFLLKENNLKRVISIFPAIEEAKVEIQFVFWKNLLSKLYPYYDFKFYNSNGDKGLKESIYRYYRLKKNIKDFGIEYKVEENLYFFVELRDNIYYGFYFYDDIVEDSKKEILDNLDMGLINEGNIYWKYPYKKLNFRAFNHQNIFDLIDEERRNIYISEISNEIIQLISNYNKGLLCLEQ